MSLLKSVTKAIGNTVAKPVHAVGALLEGDTSQALKDVKNSMLGLGGETLKRETGLSTDQILGATAALAATQGMSAGGLLGESGILGSLSGLGSSLLGGLSSIGSGISGLGSALLSGLGDYFDAEKQWKYQKEAMALQDQYNKEAEARQFEYNRQMLWKQDYMNQRAEDRAMQNNIQLWNMQNEYNTPAAQMQRLTDADLNPNLAYGTANTTAGAVSAPASHGVSSHGVSTRATKALVRQAMALNYQQIVSNQLQNAMMAEQIADKRANRALALEQYPLDMAYKQAQIDAIRNGYGLRVQDIGLRHAEIQAAAAERADQNAWRRYRDDLTAYEKELSAQLPGMRDYYVKTHRKPMYMDYR